LIRKTGYPGTKTCNEDIQVTCNVKAQKSNVQINFHKIFLSTCGMKCSNINTLMKICITLKPYTGPGVLNESIGIKDKKIAKKPNNVILKKV
jgi:hypothetical protein